MPTEGKLPEPFGWKLKRKLIPNEPYDAARVQRAKTLRDMTGDFVLFTPALLYRFLPFPADLAQQYCLDRGQPIGLFQVQCHEPVFDGLETDQGRGWNHLLFGVPKSEWSGFEEYIQGIGILEPKRGSMVRLYVYSMNILDPLSVKLGLSGPRNLPPLVEVKIVGLDGEHLSVSLEYGFHPTEPPRPAVRETPFDDPIRKFADALRDGETDPHPLLKDSVDDEVSAGGNAVGPLAEPQ